MNKKNTFCIKNDENHEKTIMMVEVKKLRNKKVTKSNHVEI